MAVNIYKFTIGSFLKTRSNRLTHDLTQPSQRVIQRCSLNSKMSSADVRLLVIT